MNPVCEINSCHFRSLKQPDATCRYLAVSMMKRNFAKLSATQGLRAVERVEKSEIFPPFPQPGDDDGDAEERKNGGGPVVVKQGLAEQSG